MSRHRSSHRTRRATLQRGTALVAGMSLMLVLVGASGLYLSVSQSGYESSTREIAGARARLASEEGLYLAIAELKSGVDTDGDGLGSVTWTGPDGRICTAVATDLGGDLYRLRSVGTVLRASLGTEVLAQRIPAMPLNFPARAAITAEGDVTTTGNIEVDGRDWDGFGTTIIGPGVFGISSQGSIGVNGSSDVGGNGVAPSGNPPSGVIEPNANWADGIDDDGDGATDEEAWDGIDNDGDGLIDEDTNDYPSDPDVFFGLAPGTLLAAAQAAGTYFATENALNAYLAANGGNIPGGVVLYLDFDQWQPADMGGSYNDPPSVIVHHNSTGTALMKNIHGSFRGLVMADFVEHINGDFSMLGAFMSFSDEQYGNAFGNGNADVFYSSEVLLNLPSTSPQARVRLLSWSRATAY